MNRVRRITKNKLNAYISEKNATVTLSYTIVTYKISHYIHIVYKFGMTTEHFAGTFFLSLAPFSTFFQHTKTIFSLVLLYKNCIIRYVVMVWHFDDINNAFFYCCCEEIFSYYCQQ